MCVLAPRNVEIEIALAVPSANTDGSRPANLTHIDIYAVNGWISGKKMIPIQLAGTRKKRRSVRRLRYQAS